MLLLLCAGPEQAFIVTGHTRRGSWWLALVSVVNGSCRRSEVLKLVNPESYRAGSDVTRPARFDRKHVRGRPAGLLLVPAALLGPLRVLPGHGWTAGPRLDPVR